jgi:hypothetical protein
MVLCSCEIKATVGGLSCRATKILFRKLAAGAARFWLSPRQMGRIGEGTGFGLWAAIGSLMTVLRTAKHLNHFASCSNTLIDRERI